MPDFDQILKAGDTEPAFVSNLKVNGAPIPDLDDADSVKMRFACTNYADEVVCTVTNVATAEVTYEWQTGDTDVPGDYIVDFVIEYATGRIQSAPNETEKNIQIRPAVPTSI